MRHCAWNWYVTFVCGICTLHLHVRFACDIHMGHRMEHLYGSLARAICTRLLCAAASQDISCDIGMQHFYVTRVLTFVCDVCGYCAVRFVGDICMGHCLFVTLECGLCTLHLRITLYVILCGTSL